MSSQLNREQQRRLERAASGGEPDATFVALVATVLSTPTDELRIPFSSLKRARWVAQLDRFQLEVSSDEEQQQLVVKLLEKDASSSEE